MFLGRVVELDFLDAEAAEQGTDFGNVVQRNHELAANLHQTLRKLLKVGRGEVVAVELPSPIRRVEVEERGRAVKAREDLIIGRTLDLYPFQSLMGIFKKLRKAFQ